MVSPWVSTQRHQIHEFGPFAASTTWPTLASRRVIRLDRVTKRFDGQVAVDELTLEVPEGELCVLVGPSGCGKTTTMKMINRLIEPTSGRIYLDGEDVTHADPV